MGVRCNARTHCPPYSDSLNGALLIVFLLCYSVLLLTISSRGDSRKTPAMPRNLRKVTVGEKQAVIF